MASKILTIAKIALQRIFNSCKRTLNQPFKVIVPCIYCLAFGGAIFIGFGCYGSPTSTYRIIGYTDLMAKFTNCEKWDVAGIWSTIWFNIGFIAELIRYQDTPVKNLSEKERGLTFVCFIFVSIAIIIMSSVVLNDTFNFKSFPVKYAKITYLSALVVMTLCFGIIDFLFSKNEDDSTTFSYIYKFNDLPTLFAFVILTTYFYFNSSVTEKNDIYNLLSGAVAFQMINLNIVTLVIFYSKTFSDLKADLANFYTEMVNVGKEV